jgi:hypothetical protein
MNSSFFRGLKWLSNPKRATLRRIDRSPMAGGFLQLSILGETDSNKPDLQ